MKRILPLIIVGILLVLLSVAGLGVVVYFTWPTGPGGGKQQPAAPFSYQQLLDMAEKPDKLAEEIPRLIACFEVDDNDICLQAAMTLQTVGAKGVDQLRVKLSDKNKNVRFWSAQTLALIGPDAGRAAPELVEALNDSEPEVRYKAVYALGKIQVRTDVVFGGLLKALEDRDENVAGTTLTVLEEIGSPPKEALPALAKLATKGPTPEVRLTATKLLGKIGTPAIPTFKELLKNHNLPEGAEVVKALAMLGSDAKPLLPDLEAAMLSNVWHAAHAEGMGIFKKCGREGADALASLIKKVTNDKTPQFDPVRAQMFFKTLGEMGSDGKSAVPTLVMLLKDRPQNHLLVLETLGDIGPAAKEAIPEVEALVRNPKDRNDPAAVALRRMGKLDKQPKEAPEPPPGPCTYKELEELNADPAKAANEIARIIACFDKDDEDLRLLAAETLKNVGAKAVEPLRAQLTHKSVHMRFWSVHALARLGPEARAAVPDVLARVDDGDANVRYKAVYALGKLGVTSDAVVAGIVKALDDKDQAVGQTAIEVLDAMPQAHKSALPTVSKLAAKGPLREPAMKLLGKMGPQAAPSFRALLKAANVNEREQVFQAMAPLGADAKVLLPELLDIVTDQIYPGGWIDPNLLNLVTKCGPEAAKGLAEALRARNTDSIAFIAREKLLTALGEMRADADANASVPILIGLLKLNTPRHPVCEYRHLILEALGNIGPAARDAIPTVEGLTRPNLKGLTDEEQKASKMVAETATVTLKRLGHRPPAKAATPKDHEVSFVTSAKDPEKVARLIATLASKDESKRLDAAEALADLGPDAGGPLRAGLKSTDDNIRFGCAQALAFLKTDAAPAVPELLACLRDRNASVRYKAVYALGKTGVRTPLVFAGLIAALEEKEDSVRDTVLAVFESFDTLPKEAAPALVKLLGKQPTRETRGKVLPILAKTGDAAVPTFRALLKDIKVDNSNPETYPDFLVGLHATRALEGPQLKSLLPELKVILAALHHRQTLEPDLMAMLQKCGPDGAMAMAESLKSVQKVLVVHQNRLELLRALGEMGPGANATVPILIDVLKVNTPKCFPVEYRPVILEALVAIGPGAREAIPAIESMLREPSVAEDAREALRRFGVKEKK